MEPTQVLAKRLLSIEEGDVKQTVHVSKLGSVSKRNSI